MSFDFKRSRPVNFQDYKTSLRVSYFQSYLRHFLQCLLTAMLEKKRTEIRKNTLISPFVIYSTSEIIALTLINPLHAKI